MGLGQRVSRSNIIASLYVVQLGDIVKLPTRTCTGTSILYVGSSTLSLAAPSTTNRNDGIRINQVQVVATHNSYHRENNLTEKGFFERLIPNPENYYYSHATPWDQLEYQAVRGFEFDVWADSEGGRYAKPLIRRLTRGELPTSPLMLKPGAKVFHVSDLDVRSTCYTIVDCLTQVKEWSDAHQDHVPIPIMIEFKNVGEEQLAIGGIDSEPWNTTNLDFLDSEIRSVFPEDRIITPDTIRRKGLTLEESVLQHGWPLLEDSRGKVLFLMDNDADRVKNNIRNPYRAGGRDSLEGRVIFTNSYPGQPDCAFMKRNDPLGDKLAQIQSLVQEGYYIRTRADEPIGTVVANNATRREIALSSGAQLVSTDFPAAGMSSRYDSEYVCQLPEHAVARCNPVNAPFECKTSDVE